LRAYRIAAAVSDLRESVSSEVRSQHSKSSISGREQVCRIRWPWSGSLPSISALDHIQVSDPALRFGRQCR
jgi:hypothetical protein